MTTIEAIFENGVFRPLNSVDLPEHARVHLAVSRWPTIAPNHPQADLWKVLSQRYEGDDPRVAERHNEHQP
jgi:predicted DNA-binding antitoxin AbrB/MazE fold protein